MPKPTPSKGVAFTTMRGTVDETGQAVTVDVPRRRKRRKGWRENVNLVDIGVLNRLELSGQEYRVLFAVLLGIPEKGGNLSHITGTRIADVTGIAAPNVSVVMRSLRERHLIQPVRRGVQEVSPWLAYSGDFDSWNAEAENWPEPVWMRGVDAATGELR